MASSAISEINNWVEGKTEGTIKDVLSPGSVDALTVLVLVNAIYFKGNWQYQFKKRLTKEADFFVTPNDTIRVQMMHQKICHAYCRYSVDLSCHVLKLPYKSGALSMLILLPDKTSSSLEDLEKKLTVEHLTNIDREYNRTDVKVCLPKFKMEEDLELKEVLNEMGMKSIFESESADLSGIDGTNQLFASKVVHKAFVDVNEEGSEAAGASHALVTVKSLSKYKPRYETFEADHPFLFLIREEKANIILFLGRVVRPTEASGAHSSSCDLM